MPDRRKIALDAAFIILYVGLIAGIVTLSLALLALLAMGVELGAHHTAAGATTLVGWIALPFVPRLYRFLVGQPFRWQANAVLGDSSA